MANSARCKCNQSVRESWGTEERAGIYICLFCDLISDSQLVGSGDTYNESEVYEYKHSLNKTIREGGVPLFTTFDIPGKEIIETLGMVSGVGNAMFTLSGADGLTSKATTRALSQLFAEAKRIEADAVVGVNLALDSFSKGFVQQLAVFTGTAVKLKK